MPTIQFECEVAAPVEVVWAFHDEIGRALPVLSPPEDDVRVESISGPAAMGCEVVITARGLFGMGRIRWQARYVDYVPPKPVAFGMEARFVDEQVRGPFAFWRHSHEFEAIDSHTTRLVDRIEYRPPLWPLSWPGDVFIIRPKLKAMFAWRHMQTRKLLGAV